MSIYALTPFAKADIFDIWCYIADDSEDAADRVEQRFTKLARLLPKRPCAVILVATSQPVSCVSGR
jgi:plasmid stabilization system protein ParE